MEYMDMINNMFNLQIKLNNNTNGTCWLNGVTKEGRGIDWDTAMILEIAEAVDSSNWKHWKDINANIVDIDNYEIEIVDTWHFLMSRLIMSEYFLKTDMVIDIANEFKDYVPMSENVFLNFNRNKYISMLEEFSIIFINNVIKNRINNSHDTMKDMVKSFINLMGMVPNFDLTKMYRLYISKNALNVFRQDNGYKEGNYIKIWNGEEDNVWLCKYVDNNDNISYESLMDYLTKEYSKISL